MKGIMVITGRFGRDRPHGYMREKGRLMNDHVMDGWGWAELRWGGEGVQLHQHQSTIAVTFDGAFACRYIFYDTKWKPRPQTSTCENAIVPSLRSKLIFRFWIKDHTCRKVETKWLLDEIPLSPSLRYHLYLSVLIFWSKNILLKNLKEKKN